MEIEATSFSYVLGISSSSGGPLQYPIQTLDLVVMAVLFGGRVALGTLLYTRLRVHYDCDGQMRFRYRRFGGMLGWILGGFNHWILDESRDGS